MSRRKTALKRQRGEDDPSSRRSGKRQADSTASPLASLLPSAAAIRETVESIVIAFVLAFLFRTFEAEAFVIPTGSMAPTLMGRHKDLVCPRCGCAYRVGSSEEVDENEVPKGRPPSRSPPAPARCAATRPNWTRTSTWRITRTATHPRTRTAATGCWWTNWPTSSSRRNGGTWSCFAIRTLRTRTISNG